MDDMHHVNTLENTQQTKQTTKTSWTYLKGLSVSLYANNTRPKSSHAALRQQNGELWIQHQRDEIRISIYNDTYHLTIVRDKMHVIPKRWRIDLIWHVMPYNMAHINPRTERSCGPQVINPCRCEFISGDIKRTSSSCTVNTMTANTMTMQGTWTSTAMVHVLT